MVSSVVGSVLTHCTTVLTPTFQIVENKHFCKVFQKNYVTMELLILKLSQVYSESVKLQKLLKLDPRKFLHERFPRPKGISWAFKNKEHGIQALA